MQSVPIATKVVISNPANGKMYSIQHYVIKFVSDRSVSPGTQVSSTNKIGRLDITKILLKVMLNTIKPNNQSSQYKINTFYCDIDQLSKEPVFALMFSPIARKPYLDKYSIYSNKFFHNFHLSESSFTCPGLQRTIVNVFKVMVDIIL